MADDQEFGRAQARPSPTDGQGAVAPSRERPILFSALMVRAILAGRKTQTRRSLKPQPYWVESEHTGGHWMLTGIERGQPVLTTPFDPAEYAKAEYGAWAARLGCPYGQPGDRLWVRETCRAVEREDGTDGVLYMADDHFRPIDNTPEAADRWVDLHAYRKGRGEKVVAIHMPRWASRITLEIAAVRVERLTDISEADAEAEGSREPSLVPIVGACWSEREAFAKLWTYINGDGSWAANPWVWVVEFRRLGTPTAPPDGEAPASARPNPESPGASA